MTKKIKSKDKTEIYFGYLDNIITNKNSCCDTYAQEILKAGFFEKESQETLRKKIRLSATWLSICFFQVKMGQNLPFLRDDSYLSSLQKFTTSVFEAMEQSMNRWNKLNISIIMGLIHAFEDNVSEDEQERYDPDVMEGHHEK